MQEYFKSLPEFLNEAKADKNIMWHDIGWISHIFDRWVSIYWGEDSNEYAKFKSKSFKIGSSNGAVEIDEPKQVNRLVGEISKVAYKILGIDSTKFKFKYIPKEDKTFEKIKKGDNLPEDSEGVFVLVSGSTIISIIAGLAYNNGPDNQSFIVFSAVKKYVPPFKNILKSPELISRTVKWGVRKHKPKSEVGFAEAKPKKLYHFTNPKSLLLILDSNMLRGSFNYEVDVELEETKWTLGAYISCTTSTKLGAKSSASGLDDSTLGGVSCMLDLNPGKIKEPMYKYKSSMVNFSENEIRILTGAQSSTNSGVKNIKSVINNIIINEPLLIAEFKSTRDDEQYAENTEGFGEDFPELAGGFSEKTLPAFYEILDGFGVKYKVTK